MVTGNMKTIFGMFLITKSLQQRSESLPLVQLKYKWKLKCKDHLYRQQRSQAGSWFTSGSAVKNKL